MEPSGRDRWQPVANVPSIETAQKPNSATVRNPPQGGGRRFESVRGLNFMPRSVRRRSYRDNPFKPGHRAKQ